MICYTTIAIVYGHKWIDIIISYHIILIYGQLCVLTPYCLKCVKYVERVI